jgi:hypothetical protein
MWVYEKDVFERAASYSASHFSAFDWLAMMSGEHAPTINNINVSFFLAERLGQLMRS